MQVSVGGRLVVGLGGGLQTAAATELDSCEVTRSLQPVDVDISRDWEVAPPDGAERAGDGGDGWLSALAGERMYLLRRAGGACAVDGRPGELPLRIAADGELPAWALMRSVTRPLLQLSLPLKGAGTVHGAAVARGGAGVLIAGWSESGKTEVALALAERGWDFVADKWTVLDEEARMAPFPVRAGVRGWALEYLPQLRAGLAARARWRMSGADRLGRGVDRVAGRARSPMAGAALAMLRHGCAQGERLSMTLSEVREIYGDRAPRREPPQVGLVVVLRTVADGPAAVQTLTATEAIHRLQQSAAYERRDSLGLMLRRRFGGGEDAVSHATAVEREVLASALGGVPFIEVSCPFPSDPRRVAALVEKRL